LQPVTISTPLVFGLPSGQATINADGLDRVLDIIQVGGNGVSLLGLAIKGGDFDGELPKYGAGITMSGTKGWFWFLDVSALNGDGIRIQSSQAESTINYSTVSGSPDRAAVSVTIAAVSIDSSSLANSRAGLYVQQPGTIIDVRNSTLSGNSSFGVQAFSDAKVTISEKIGRAS